MKTPPAARTATIQGLKGLTTFLQKERFILKRDTIVLVTSEPPLHAKSRPGVEMAVKQIKALLIQKLNWRIAPVTVLTSIPDPSSVQLYEMVKRMAAKTVIAVGCGAAMDAAKWCNYFPIRDKHHGQPMIRRIIYVPATYGGCLAAHAKRSLLVDANTGEIDVARRQRHFPRSSDDEFGDDIEDEDDNDNDEDPQSQLPRPVPAVHHVLLDPVHFDTEDQNMALAAALAIGADAGVASLPSLLLPETHRDLYDFISKTATDHLSYGLLSGKDGSRPRSKPLAIATALQATLFPKYTLMEIMASLLPAYYNRDNNNNANEAAILQRLDVPQFLTSEPWETVAAALRENAATWNCYDAPEEELRQLLSHRHMI
jgi:hypothetical protein